MYKSVTKPCYFWDCCVEGKLLEVTKPPLLLTFHDIINGAHTANMQRKEKKNKVENICCKGIGQVMQKNNYIPNKGVINESGFCICSWTLNFSSPQFYDICYEQKCKHLNTEIRTKLNCPCRQNTSFMTCWCVSHFLHRVGCPSLSNDLISAGQRLCGVQIQVLFCA